MATDKIKTCTEICIEADNNKDNALFLSDLWDQVSENKDKYEPEQISFIYEHIGKYMNKIQERLYAKSCSPFGFTPLGISKPVVLRFIQDPNSQMKRILEGLNNFSNKRKTLYSIRTFPDSSGYIENENNQVIFKYDTLGQCEMFLHRLHKYL